MYSAILILPIHTNGSISSNYIYIYIYISQNCFPVLIYIYRLASSLLFPSFKLLEKDVPGASFVHSDVRQHTNKQLNLFIAYWANPGLTLLSGGLFKAVVDPYRRHMIGRDGHLDQSYANELGQLVWEYYSLYKASASQDVITYKKNKHLY